MTLAEQGYSEMPAALGDWLLAIDDTLNRVEAAAMERARSN